MGGSASDHERHPLLQNDGPMQKIMNPPLKLTCSHHVRAWCFLVHRHPSYMGQVYQPQPMQAHLHMR